MNANAQASSTRVTGPKLDNRRVLAGVVDLAIVVAGAVVILFAADALSGDRGDIRSALSAVIVGWALYYYFAVESGAGQTVGKRLMKLRVVRADGRPAGMREIAVRTALRVVDGVGLYIVGLIVMLVTGEKRQRLGDLAAGTIVVDASAPAIAPPAAAAQPAEEIEADAIEADAIEPEDVEADIAPESATITLPARPAPPVTEPAVEEPVVEEPVVEEPVEDEPVESVEDESSEPEFTVKSVETVSAIDLVMGGAPDEDSSSDSGSEPVR